MRKAYPSDLTDAQWEIIRPLIPIYKLGRPREVDLREVVNAIFYLNRSGCQWDMLPHDLQPKSTAYDYFQRWRDDGTWQRLVDALRGQLRLAAGREETPSVRTKESEETLELAHSVYSTQSRDTILGPAALVENLPIVIPQ